MKLSIQNNYDKASQWAAEHVIKSINEAQPTADKPFVLGLPTGSTPLGMYRYLIEACNNKRVSFEHVVTYNMDEYVGLTADHEQSYHFFMWDNFFNHIDIKKENVHILDGLASDPEAECAAYEAAIKAQGGIDLFIGGVGADGHIAFNEPGTSLNSRTNVARLTDETIRDNSRFFNDESEVPVKALTVGIGTVTDSRQVMIIITGANKALALQQAVEGAVSHHYPITALQMHPNSIIVCDDAACEELKVKTYNYHKKA